MTGRHSAREEPVNAIAKDLDGTPAETVGSGSGRDDIGENHASQDDDF